MVYISLSMCDWCGKRTSDFRGKLTLYEDIKTKEYRGTKTTRSWKLCHICHSKLSGISTIGDNIKSDIELAIDNVQSKLKSPKILNLIDNSIRK